MTKKPPAIDSTTDQAAAADSLRPPIPTVRHDLRILQSLRRIIRATELHSRDLASRYKVTAPQLICLLTLKEHGPLTAKDLSDAIYLSPSTVVGILDRLEGRALISRKRDDADRRRIYVSITAAGEQLTADTPSPLQDKLFYALQELPDLEQATIALSLERVVDLMEASDVEGEPMLEAGPLSQTAEGKELVSKVEDET